MSVKTKKVNKKSDVEKTPKKEPKLGDILNLDDLVGVKGKNGIFMPIVRKPNKSGLLAVKSWEDALSPPPTKTHMVNVKNLVLLGELQFLTKDEIEVDVVVQELNKKTGKLEIPKKKEDRKTKKKKFPKIYNLRDVFNNLQEYEEKELKGDISVGDLDTKNPDTCQHLMSIVVPNFREDKFYPSHMRNVIKWFEASKRALFKINELKVESDEK